MRKGQAAVEYLTTYGWALLVLVILVAVLFSSGLLSPNIAMTEGCQFGTSIPCSFAVFDHGAAPSGTTQMSLRIFNGFSYTIKVTDIELSTADGTAKFAWSGANVPPLDIPSGGNVTLVGTLSSMVPAGSIQQFDGNLSYVSCAPEINGTGCGVYPHMITGRVTGKVISGS